MIAPDYQYYRNILKDYAFPLAFIDLDLFDKNITEILQRANGKNIRVASKSIRCLSLLQRILKYDASIQGIMCFSPQEVVCLSQAGLDDLLLGYPCWNKQHIQAIADEIKQGKQIVLMVDSIEHIHHLEQIAKQNSVILPVCLDIDMSIRFPMLHFGVLRSSIIDVQSALRVYDVIGASPHIRLDGVMGYEAQIAGVGDHIPNNWIKSQAIRWLKQFSIPKIAKRRAEIIEALQARRATIRFVNGGGTGSIESTLAEDVVTEVTVGSGFYAPKLFDYYDKFQHQPAAAYAIEIVRQPKADIYTCSGGGYIASGNTGKDKEPQVYLPEGATLTSLEGAGEVQTPIHYTSSEKLQLGDPIFMRHSKAGELCERFNTLLLISDGKVVEQVQTYRGQSWCFL